MAEKFIPFDPARWLDTIAGIEVFLADAFETHDASHIGAAMVVAARSPGMGALAYRRGVPREELVELFLTSSTLPEDQMMAAIAEAGLEMSPGIAPAKHA